MRQQGNGGWREKRRREYDLSDVDTTPTEFPNVRLWDVRRGKWVTREQWIIGLSIDDLIDPAALEDYRKRMRESADLAATQQTEKGARAEAIKKAKGNSRDSKTIAAEGDFYGPGAESKAVVYDGQRPVFGQRAPTRRTGGKRAA